MKVLLIACAIVLNGCATRPVDPARIMLVVAPATQVCGDSDRVVPVYIKVHNESRGKLRVLIDPKFNQPPYDLSWLSYKVLSDGAVDWRHGPGGHGPMPPSTLSIGPGDSAQVVGSLYNLRPEDYVRRFKIQFKDEADHTFVSDSFRACVSR